MAKISKVLAINFALLILPIILLELVFGNWIQTNPAKRLPDLARQTNKRYKFRTHGLTGEDVTVNFYRDKLGLRGRNESEKASQILVLGGSTAIEFTVPEKLTWAEQLEIRLNQQLPKSAQTDVINAGINGQTLLGNKMAVDLWLKHIKEVQPKLVIIYYGFNDALYSTKKKSQALQDPDLKAPNIKEILKVNSALAILARELKGSYTSWATNNRHNFDYIPASLPVNKELRSGNTQSEDFAISKSIYHEKLMSIINSLKRAWPTSKIIFVAQSNPNCLFESFTHFRPLNDPKICSDMLSIHRHTRLVLKTLAKAGDKQLEFEPLFLKNPYDRFGSSDDIHTNSIGSRNIAEALAPMLLKYMIQ